MFETNVLLSDDGTTCDLTLPGMSKPLKVAASELEELVRHLGWVRASMQPAIPVVDLAQGTPISSVPTVRYQVTGDDIPGQFRLYLLHPGYGWVHIHLYKEALEKIVHDAQPFLQEPTSIQ